MTDSLTDRIDACLPQAQCRQCGYPACRPYAEAVAAGRAGINQCPPGGEETIRELAALTRRPFAPLDRAFGATKPPMVAVIDEAACIGCTLCMRACPVDAIVGAIKLMHTVISAECTGCELCLPPCPVDCISMEAREPALPRRERAAHARRRFLARNARLAREKAKREVQLARRRDEAAEKLKRETIERVMARARARLHGRSR